MTAEQIAAALGGEYRSGEWHRCRCPVHQSGGPTLALRDRPGGLIVHCHAGCPCDDVLTELRRLGLHEGEGEGTRCAPDLAETERRRAAEERDQQRRIADARDFWRHEDVPMTAEMGAPFGRLIATQVLASIVDLSEPRSNAAHRGFMTAFAKAIYEEFYFLYEKQSSNPQEFKVT